VPSVSAGRGLPVFGFDTETYYKRGYDVKSLGVDRYVADPRFDCYLVSFWGPNGSWCGHPRECPWDRFHGAVWVSHNSRFDRAVFFRMQALGVVSPHVAPAEWHDTAALAVYLQAPRSLAGAAEQLLGRTLDKSVRDEMRGVDWLSALAMLRDEHLKTYALEDARAACDLWLAHADKWPEGERRLAWLTVEQGEHGIQLDRERVEVGIATLHGVCQAAERALPWHGSGKPTSAKELAIACSAIGVPPPPSTSEDDPACDEWEERFGGRAPWIGHIRSWRKANRVLRVLETMRDRCRPDCSLPFSLKYFGAIATGRWSGDAGLNLQNFNREAIHGVDPRSCLRARPGHRLIIADLSQIEPRVLAWLAGDHDLLARVRSGENLYEAHARLTMGWTPDAVRSDLQISDQRSPICDGDRALLKRDHPHLYLLAKCRVIGLGYGAGAVTFRNLAKTYGLDITSAEAKTTVDDFRRANSKITALWRALEHAMRRSAGTTFFMRLPSGRVIRYFGVEVAGDDSLSAATERGGRLLPWYGGKLTENLVQATARDVFAEGILRIHEAGIRVLWSVHDEVICEVPSDSDVTAAVVTSLLAQTPSWMPGLPVAAEGRETDRYGK
jgi:hypothetical protein